MDLIRVRIVHRIAKAASRRGKPSKKKVTELFNSHEYRTETIAESIFVTEEDQFYYRFVCKDNLHWFTKERVIS